MELTILFWFTIKHFICDFPLQATPWIYRNKGTYGHGGGIVHAFIHGVGTYLVLLAFTSSEIAIAISLLDSFLHYHIDWAKMNLSKKFNLRPDNSERFWILLGLDQLLHMLTYIAFVKFITL